MKRFSVVAFAVAALFATVIGPIHAQVQQSGTVTPGQAARWITNGVIGSAGPATNGALTTLGVTSSAACAIGVNSAAISSPTGYQQLCLGFNGVNGVVSLTGLGGASTAGGIQIVANGNTFQIGGANWLSAILDNQFSPAQGAVIYRGATSWTALAPGAAGQALLSGGAAANPYWANTSGTGTVTSITAGSGLSGGTITGSGTISISAPISVANGGTGNTSLTQYAVMIGNAASAVQFSAPGGAGTCLISNGVSAAPTFQACVGTGTVTSIATGAGLTGGTITTSGTVAVATNGISNALFRQSAGVSVVGRSVNSTGDVADIAASADNQILTRQSGTLAFSASLSGLSINDTTIGGSTPNTGSFTSLNLTGSSAPANGVYLPAANSLGFATSSTEFGRINSSQQLLVGTTASIGAGFVSTRIDIAGTSGPSSAVSVARFDNNANGNTWIQAKSRGTTVGTHAVVQSGDAIGQWNVYGSNGTTWELGGFMSFTVDAAAGSGDMPTRWGVSTSADGTASPSEALRVNNAGAVFFPRISTTASAANAFLDSGSSPANSLLRSTSSSRYKRDIETLPASISRRIFDVRSVRYRSAASADDPDLYWYGFIAEEVAEIDPRLVTWGYQSDQLDDNGKPKSGESKRPDGVQYERFIVLAIAEMRAMRARIEALEAGRR